MMLLMMMMAMTTTTVMTNSELQAPALPPPPTHTPHTPTSPWQLGVAPAANASAALPGNASVDLLAVQAVTYRLATISTSRFLFLVRVATGFHASESDRCCVSIHLLG